MPFTNLGLICRKRRKWDQPAEALVSGGIAPLQKIFPLVNVGSLVQMTLPSISSVAGAPLAVTFSNSSPVPIQVPPGPLQQQAAAIVQKLVQVRLL